MVAGTAVGANQLSLVGPVGTAEHIGTPLDRVGPDLVLVRADESHTPVP